VSRWRRALYGGRMLSIGLTGGIASGKSAVARMLGERGAHVLDADRAAHETYAPGTEGFEALVRTFGPEIVGEDGAIDRRRLGQLVFNDAARLVQLSAIVWPLTRRLVEERKREQEASGTRVFVVEAALLIEAGWQDLVDEIWLVRSPRQAVLQRLRERGLDAVESERRVAAATDVEAAAAQAHRVIENDGTLEDLERKVAEAWAALGF
jgi:dephospho-CoA kinase